MNVQEEILRLKERVSVLEGRLAQQGSSAVAAAPQKKQSIKEFALSKSPKDDTQKVLLVGYYLEKNERFSSFNVKDLEDGFQNSKEKAPGNINDRVNSLIRQGFMMKAKGKKDNKAAWALTNSGERFVDDGFPAKQ